MKQKLLFIFTAFLFSFSSMAQTVIVQNPIDQAVCEGDIVTLNVMATGTSLSYQWFDDNQALPNEVTSSLTIFNATSSNSGSYYCAVSSPGYPVVYSAVATVFVNQSPAILQQPFSLLLCEGGTATVSVQAIGINIFYQWYHDGVSIPGATTANYVIPNVTLADNGSYICEISDVCQPSITSSQAVITVLEGYPATFFADVITCDSYTLPALNINGANYYTAPNGLGATIAEGSILTASTMVYIYAANPVCQFNESYSVTIYPSELIGEIVSSGPLAICPGEQLQLFAGVNSPENMSYNWSSGPDSGEILFNPNDAASVSVNQPGTYYCSVMSPCGSTMLLSVTVTIGTECVLTENSISGTVRFDSEDNGCSETDTPAPGIQVRLGYGNYLSYAYTDAEGNYSFNNLAEGQYAVTITGGIPSGYLIWNPEPVANISIAGTSQSVTRNWCITTPQPVTNAVVYLFANTSARPGFETSYSIIVSNNGSVPFSGNLSFTFDSSKVDFNSSTPSATSQIGSSLNFDVNNLAPFTYSYHYISFTVKVPPIVNAGDLLVFNANMTTVNSDVNPDDNVAAITQVVVNSFDPNDIAVQQGPEILQNQVDDYLNYTIRFQNTGTADAINVRVENELDALLDWSTFRPVASSHVMTTERVDGNVVFRFDGIHLPASSVDEVGSNGYITYKIKPKLTLQLGDVISNFADIYFDFNLPIVTNTVTTELVNALGVTENGFANVKIYPNPASDKITVQFEETLENVSISVYDLQGKMIVNSNVSLQGNSTVFDVSKIQPGMYFVKIVSGNQSTVRKLIVN